MSWVEVFAAFFVAHLVGDYLLQTEFQAVNKRGGLSGGIAARALLGHTVMYTLAYVPVLVWLAGDLSALELAAVAAAVGIPHCVQDDGRLLAVWMTRVKRTPASPGLLAMMVDQSFHIVVLFVLAVVVGR